MKYIIATLGCKVNQYESQAMESLLLSRGHQPAAPGEIAQAVILNSCAVTAESGRKSRQTLRRLQGENPGALLAVCGCYAQLEPERLRQAGARVIFGSDGHEDFILAVERALAEAGEIRGLDEPFRRKRFERLPAGAASGRTRAMLKIQDGCVNFCSYCVIPYTRGRLRSLPAEEACEETARLAREGFGELVLTGIEIAAYGRDLPEGPDLAGLVVRLAEVSGDMRLRLGSLEPTVVDEDFCRRLSGTGKLCRHFHLSLQSGCDRTLSAMARRYDTARFRQSAALLRRHFPGCALTADLICGFPGETEEDQAQTLAFLEEMAFADVHVFPYSRRPGTKADALPEQCSQAVKSRRAAQARAVAEQSRRSYWESQLGQVLPVLFESQEEGSLGHSDNYLPVRVAQEGLQGRTLPVRVVGLSQEALLGELA